MRKKKRGILLPGRIKIKFLKKTIENRPRKEGKRKKWKKKGLREGRLLRLHRWGGKMSRSKMKGLERRSGIPMKEREKKKRRINLERGKGGGVGHTFREGRGNLLCKGRDQTLQSKGEKGKEVDGDLDSRKLESTSEKRKKPKKKGAEKRKGKKGEKTC